MTATTTSEVESPVLVDIMEIVELTANLGLLVDAREWDPLEGLFTESVDVDYTSLSGGAPQMVNASDLVMDWRQTLDHLDATQHLIAGQVVRLDGDQASCAANVQATHMLANATGGPIWTVAGRYDFGLIRTSYGWRINAVTFTVQWATGNQHLTTPTSEAQS